MLNSVGGVYGRNQNISQAADAAADLVACQIQFPNKNKKGMAD